jgi:hypothetical protein
MQAESLHSVEAIKAARAAVDGPLSFICITSWVPTRGAPQYGYAGVAVSMFARLLALKPGWGFSLNEK